MFFLVFLFIGTLSATPIESNAPDKILPDALRLLMRDDFLSNVSQASALALQEIGFVSAQGVINKELCQQWVNFCDQIAPEFAQTTASFDQVASFIKRNYTTIDSILRQAITVMTWYALYLIVEEIVCSEFMQKYGCYDEQDRMVARVLFYSYGYLFVTFIDYLILTKIPVVFLNTLLQYIGDQRPLAHYRLTTLASRFNEQPHGLPVYLKSLFKLVSLENHSVKNILGNGVTFTEQEAANIVRAIMLFGGLARTLLENEKIEKGEYAR